MTFKNGDRVRLINHRTAPHLIGQIFTISEEPREGRVMLEDPKLWLKADVDHIEPEFPPGRTVRYRNTGEFGEVVRDSDNPALVFVLYEGDSDAKATMRVGLELID